MFKLILKHAITDFALTVMFDKLQENITRIPINSLVGKFVAVRITEESRCYHNFNDH